VLKVSMELGGNAPFLVFEDADLDAAVEGALLAKMRNGGEACTSANRFHVHESVAEAFADKLTARIGALKVGRGTEDGVQVGPLIDEAQRTKVAELVDDAVGKGARVLTGGSRLLAEEIFGPVAPITTFSSDEEAIAKANDTEYGLVSYLFTQDIDRAFKVIEALDTGMIGFNQGMVSNAGAPFGGVKQSGFGREGGPEGLDEYLETKYVAMNVGIGPTKL
jgi:succinate-semialdehyde dehydrogenase / glutarate-semialdehyde dehydrogenase